MTMEPRSGREVAIPAETLVRVREAVRGESGPRVADRSLRAAGTRAGEALAERLLDPSGPTRAADFWSRLSDHFRERGWGELVHERLHPAVGMLSSADWAEGCGEDETRPACAYTSGQLAALLSGVAGDPVAVLETECRSCGDGRCAFVFGSEGVVKRLGEDLLDGRGLSDALDRL